MPREGEADEGAGLRPSAAPGEGDADGREIEVPLALASEEERLAEKSFAALTPEELARLRRMMAELELATPQRRKRRVRRARRGERLDLRRTLRASLRTGGDPIRLVRRRRRTGPRRLVLLCDISGSMEPYARAYLQLLRSAIASGTPAEAFVFATRLTRLTRALGGRNPEAAIQRAAAAAPGLVRAGRGSAQALRELQRPLRAPRDGARGGGGDPLRRLGARRPGARRPRDGAPRPARAPDRLGQPAGERARASSPGPGAWPPRCRTATRSSAATA